MEARTKIIAAVAVIMMCAAGLVGAGYAYTASTVNSDNDVTSEYVVLSQAGTGAYQFANNIYVYYNTVNTSADASTGTLYTLDGATENVVTGATVTQLGKAFTVAANGVNNGNVTPLSCTFTTNGFDVTTGWKFYIVSGNTVYTQTGADTWSASAFNIVYENSAYTPVEFKVYYGYEGNSGTTNVPDSLPLEDAKITFTYANDAEHNTGIILDIPAGRVTAAAGDGHTLKLTAALRGVTGTIVWESSNGEKATVSDAGLVTGVAAGDNIVITAKVQDTTSQIWYTATCVIDVV